MELTNLKPHIKKKKVRKPRMKNLPISDRAHLIKVLKLQFERAEEGKP